MERTAIGFLTDWLSNEVRKPLVVRGARQVGKTWLIRHFAQLTKKNLIEINFEKAPQLAKLFDSNVPQEILLALSLSFNRAIDPKDSILFLDEIQAVPTILAKLRWFAEDFPGLPVVAAGSLLEFVLADHDFSMPVGRISYMHLEPLSFEEFLVARGRDLLKQYLASYNLSEAISPEIHRQLMSLFKEYVVIGGMPSAVASWCKDNSLLGVNQIQSDLLATYRDDFSKYRGRIALERLEELIEAVPRLLGQKFVFSRVNQAVQAESFKRALTMLNRARVCHRVISTAGNGVPLASETNPKFFKQIMVDTGLSCSALGLSLNQFNAIDEIALVNSGAIAEQIVGQMLRTIDPFYVEPNLFYWLRDQKGSQAEVDYLIQHRNQVIPVEVKAGSQGTLRSLNQFIETKKLKVAVRICSAPPRLTTRHYTLLSLPFYLCGQIHRLLDYTDERH